ASSQIGLIPGDDGARYIGTPAADGHASAVAGGSISVFSGHIAANYHVAHDRGCSHAIDVQTAASPIGLGFIIKDLQMFQKGRRTTIHTDACSTSSGIVFD